jgi:hypothetical protein
MFMCDEDDEREAQCGYAAGMWRNCLTFEKRMKTFEEPGKAFRCVRAQNTDSPRTYDRTRIMTKRRCVCVYVPRFSRAGEQETPTLTHLYTCIFIIIYAWISPMYRGPSLFVRALRLHACEVSGIVKVSHNLVLCSVLSFPSFPKRPYVGYLRFAQKISQQTKFSAIVTLGRVWKIEMMQVLFFLGPRGAWMIVHFLHSHVLRPHQQHGHL